jgi:hypothetical protein
MIRSGKSSVTACILQICLSGFDMFSACLLITEGARFYGG